MVACLKIGEASSSTAIHRCVSTVPLMSRSRMPAGERQWTCRVYVKEALNALHNDRILSLPASVGKSQERFPSIMGPTYIVGIAGSIERACLAVANSYLPYRQSYQQPGIYNDLACMRSSTSRTAPMEIDSNPYYPSRMEVDSSRRYSSSRSYGSLMEVDSSAGRRVTRY